MKLTRAMAVRANCLRTEGLSDADIARRLTAEAPHGSRLVVTQDDVFRMCRQISREQRAE